MTSISGGVSISISSSRIESELGGVTLPEERKAALKTTLEKQLRDELASGLKDSNKKLEELEAAMETNKIRRRANIEAAITPLAAIAAYFGSKYFMNKYMQGEQDEVEAAARKKIAEGKKKLTPIPKSEPVDPAKVPTPDVPKVVSDSTLELEIDIETPPEIDVIFEEPGIPFVDLIDNATKLSPNIEGVLKKIQGIGPFDQLSPLGKQYYDAIAAKIGSLDALDSIQDQIGRTGGYINKPNLTKLFKNKEIIELVKNFKAGKDL